MSDELQKPKAKAAPKKVAAAKPAAKKLKVSPPESPGTNDVQSGQVIMDAAEGEWTKVEKRKSKKLRRAGVKLDVCVFLFCDSSLSWADAVPLESGKPHAFLI